MKPRVCFLDIDDVLTDFRRQAKEMCHIDSAIFKYKPAEKLTNFEKAAQQRLFYFCDCVDDFWKTMKPKKGASFLYNYCLKKFDSVHFLGGYCPSPEYSDRFEVVKKIKENWIKEHIKGIQDSSQIIITPVSKTQIITPAMDCFLIDDMKKNIDSWEKSGGKGILYTTTIETIKTIHALTSSHFMDMLMVQKHIRNFYGNVR